MTERQKFIKPDELIVIHDSDYKTTRKAKISFQANYLQFKEEIKIMVERNIKIYSRNYKSLIFIFTSPIILMLLLQIIQMLSDEYSTSQIVKNPQKTYLNNIDLNCKNSKYFSNEIENNKNEKTNDCISIGVSVLVLNYYIKFLNTYFLFNNYN